MSSLFRGRVRRIHFVGIGGVGMSGIAEVLLNLGFEVHGSDMRSSETTRRLQSMGAVVHRGHDASNVEGTDVVVKSTAVTTENPEVAAALSTGIPVIPRAEMLAELMRLKHGIAVAGSHGKTTTTSLVAAILHHGGIDPTVVIGGKVNQLGSNARLGQGEYLVAEADESDGSFVHLTPTIGVVTNLDEEHLDHWTGGIEQLKDAFADFVNRLPFYGLAVLCSDAENVQALLPRIKRRHVTYGFNRQADLQAHDLVTDGMHTRFTVHKGGQVLGEVRLGLAGKHNVLNALAAIAVADELGVSFAHCQEALEAFEGVQRRFTLRGEKAGVTVVDDYGHHPTEIRATLQAARAAFGERRVVVLFQPHRYSRTHHHLDDFSRSFNEADMLRVTEIYAAGEAPIEGITAQRLVDEVRRHGHRDAHFTGELDSAVAQLADDVRPGDVVITLGAGTITNAGPALLDQLPGVDTADVAAAEEA